MTKSASASSSASRATGASNSPASVASGSIVDSVQTLVDQGSETIDQIRSRVTDATEQARARSAAIYDRTAELVTQHPLKSLALAFGIGYIAMRITTSKLTSLAMVGGVIYAGARLLRS